LHGAANAKNVNYFKQEIMSLLLDYVKKQLSAEVNHPKFKAGDTITVHYKIREGEKERIQQFSGVVIQRKNEPATASFTVRKISNGIGVERIFPVSSPFIDKIELNKTGIVRRAKIYYIRTRTGKAARIREKVQNKKENA
jgi:large subunit ribosomal protein L19